MRIFLLVTLAVAGIVSAQTVRRYEPTFKETQVDFGSDTVTITFQTDVSLITQKVYTTPNFRFDLYDWGGFFGRYIGAEMDPVKASLLSRVSSQLHAISEEKRLTPDELFNLTLSFVRALRNAALSRPPEDGHIYQPYELLIAGPASGKEEVWLLSALLSSLCYDIELVAFRERWNLGVLSSAARAAEGYVSGGSSYRFVPVAGEPSPCSDPDCVGRVEEIDELCDAADAAQYKEGLRERPAAVYSANEINSYLASNPTIGVVKSEGRGWRATLSVASSTLSQPRRGLARSPSNASNARARRILGESADRQVRVSSARIGDKL